MKRIALAIVALLAAYSVITAFAVKAALDYRLAFAAYSQGDLERAAETLRSYAAQDRPDEDAEPFMLQLLAAMAAAEARGAATVSTETSADLGRVRQFAALPRELALGLVTNAADCRAAITGFMETDWLAALLTDSNLAYSARLTGEPAPSGRADLCGRYFRAAASGDATKLAGVLEDLAGELREHLAQAPLSDETPRSEEGAAGLTDLSRAISGRVTSIEASGRAVPPQLLAWLEYAHRENKQMECQAGMGQFCAAKNELESLHRRLIGQ